MGKKKRLSLLCRYYKEGMSIDEAAGAAGYKRSGHELLCYKSFRDALGIGCSPDSGDAEHRGRSGRSGSRKSDIADSQEVLQMLTSVMRGSIREPVVVLEQLTGTTGKTERAARVIEKSASVKERMSAAEMLARRYGILDGGDDESVIFTGEERLLLPCSDIAKATQEVLGAVTEREPGGALGAELGVEPGGELDEKD